MSRLITYIAVSILIIVPAAALTGDLRVTGQFVSEATSEPPLVVNSSNKV